jgi:hypothetical protein
MNLTPGQKNMLVWVDEESRKLAEQLRPLATKHNLDPRGNILEHAEALPMSPDVLEFNAICGNAVRRLVRAHAHCNPTELAFSLGLQTGMRIAQLTHEQFMAAMFGEEDADG